MNEIATARTTYGKGDIASYMEQFLKQRQVSLDQGLRIAAAAEDGSSTPRTPRPFPTEDATAGAEGEPAVEHRKRDDERKWIDTYLTNLEIERERERAKTVERQKAMGVVVDDDDDDDEDDDSSSGDDDGDDENDEGDGKAAEGDDDCDGNGESSPPAVAVPLDEDDKRAEAEQNADASRPAGEEGNERAEAEAKGKEPAQEQEGENGAAAGSTKKSGDPEVAQVKRADNDGEEEEDDDDDLDLDLEPLTINTSSGAKKIDTSSEFNLETLVRHSSCGRTHARTCTRTCTHTHRSTKLIRDTWCADPSATSELGQPQADGVWRRDAAGGQGRGAQGRGKRDLLDAQRYAHSPTSVVWCGVRRVRRVRGVCTQKL